MVGTSLNAALILKRENLYIAVIFQFLLVWNLYQPLLGVSVQIIEEEVAMAQMTKGAAEESGFH